jgi:tetratricopeptide (TPR) repeat protein
MRSVIPFVTVQRHLRRKYSIAVMANTPEWVQQARDYIAIGASQARDQAIAAVSDADIRAALQNPGAWRPAHHRLVQAGLRMEAGTVELLGLRPAAAAVDSVENLGPQQRDAAIDACNRAAGLSNALQFGECEAYFLAMMGSCASKMHEYVQATAILTRALALLRDAAKRNAAHVPLMAGTLSDLSISFSERKLFPEALKSLEEALALYRRLAERHPDYYRPDIARNLGNLGVVRKNAGDLRGSVATFMEAVSVYREMPADQFATHKFNFAGTLTGFSTAQRALRDLGSARRSVEEARTIYRELAQTQTRACTPYIALTSHNLGNILMNLEEPKKAEAEYLEALKIYRALANAEPTRHGGELASTLQKMGAVLMEEKRPGDALTAYNESLSIYRRLAEAQPEVYRSNVANALDSLANAQDKAGDPKGALKPRREAIEMERQAVSEKSGAPQRDLMRMLANLASNLKELGDKAGCDATSKEAVEMAESNPDADSLWLDKAEAREAYKHMLGVAVEAKYDDAVFRTLAAMREGPVRAFGHNPEESLDAACRELAAVGQRVGRPVCVLAAQSLHRNFPDEFGDVVLVRVDSAIRYEACYGFATAAYELFNDLQGVFTQGRPAAYRKQRMAELGSAAWKALPEDLREVLHPASGVEVLVSGDTYWSAFPWEALRFGDGEDDYLGFARPLARWSRLTAGALSTLAPGTATRGNQVAAVICPWDWDPKRPLQGARAEAEALSRDLPFRGFTFARETPAVGQSATVFSLASALRSRLAVFHYTGHGDIIGTEEVLLLNGGAFGPSELRALRQNAGHGALFEEGAMVVLNSCLTGRVREYGGRREDLAGAFLDGGARGVVASALPVADPIGQVLGTAIYALAGRRPMGHTMAGIRQIVASLALQANANSYPTWTMIQYHGDPWLASPGLATAPGSALMEGLVEAVASLLQTTPEKAAATLGTVLA